MSGETPDPSLAALLEEFSPAKGFGAAAAAAAASPPAGHTFVTFCAGSPAYYAAGLRLCRQVSAGRLFARVVCYTDVDLRQDAEFWARHGKFIGANRRGFGYWLWKPYVVCRERDRAGTAMLLYADAGCEYRAANETLLEKAMREVTHIGAASSNFPLGQWTKRDAFLRFSMDLSPYHRTMLCQAGVLLVSDHARARACLQEWWEVCQEYALINDDASSAWPEHAFFKAHRHDQSLLNLCLLKYDALSLRLRCQDPFPLMILRNRTGETRLGEEVGAPSAGGAKEIPPG